MTKSDWKLKLEPIGLFHSCLASRGAVENNPRGKWPPSVSMVTPERRVDGGARIRREKSQQPLRWGWPGAVVRINQAGQAASAGSGSAGSPDAGNPFNSTGCGDDSVEQVTWHSLCESSAANIQFNSFRQSMWRGQCQRPSLTTEDNREVISVRTVSGVSSGKSFEPKPVAVARFNADTNPCLSSA